MERLQALYQRGKTPEEQAKRKAQVEDCAMSRAAAMGSMCFTGSQNKPISPESNLHCCAITASAVLSQISAEMGYDGSQNFMVANKRNDSANNIVSAVYMAQNDSIAPAYRLNSGQAPLPQKRQKTLNELVKSGEIGIGDAVAVASSDNNTSSGYHAMTIAEVHKDAAGNITGYTLQANNKHCLKTVDVNGQNGYWGRKRVINAAKTHEWMESQISAERQNLSALSIEELEAEVTRARAETNAAIESLEQTETYNAAKGYDAGIRRSYAENLENLQQNRYAEARQSLKADSIQALNFAQSPNLNIPSRIPAIEPRPITGEERRNLHQEMAEDRAKSEALLPEYIKKSAQTNGAELKTAMFEDFMASIKAWQQQNRENATFLPTLSSLINSQPSPSSNGQQPSSSQETPTQSQPSPSKIAMLNLYSRTR